MAATASVPLSAVDVGKPVDVRVRQIVCFLAGALAMELLVDQGEVRFYWTPLILGLTYLAAAAVGGRHGGHWSGATTLTGFGLAVAYAGHEHPQNVDISGLYVLGAGLAFAIGAVAASRGWPISTVSMGVTLAIVGGLLAFSGQVDQFVDGRWYVYLLAAVAVANALAAALALRRGGRR